MAWVGSEGMMKTVIFDLDGTLCDISHRLPLIKKDKPNWDSFFLMCEYDEPKPEIIALFQALKSAGHNIVIVSGRSDKVKDMTSDWLKKHDCFPTWAIMRPDGNHMPDDKLKKQWLDDGLLGPKEDILFCVDDRQRVVDMWRNEGLTCLQVAAWEE
jgi:phosphoglycolate phosphatase-like HAD superfamily hydrolase